MKAKATTKTRTRRKAAIVQRATPENPRYSLDSPELWESWGATKSSAGLSINREVALTYSAWWRAVNLISSSVGKLPLLVYRRLSEGGKERATEHPAYRLLRRTPNEFMTPLIFRQTIQAHVLNGGNGYAWIGRNGDGTPRELLPLNPDQTYPVRVNGDLWYVTAVKMSDTQTQSIKLRPSEVLHVRGMGFDGLQGYSVIKFARESLGEGVAAREYSSKFFSNDATPGFVLEHPAKLGEKALKVLRESWQSMHGGVKNSHRLAILEEGMKANPLSKSAKESQLLELRQFNIRDIANWTGVPPHKLGDQTRTSYNSLEQENQSYLDDALDVWLVTWEEECWEKLLTEEEKDSDSHVVEFLRQALVRADFNTRANYYRAALGGAPWMTINEVRDLENQNPVDDADDILKPLNMGDAGGADNEPKDEPPAMDVTPEEMPDEDERKLTPFHWRCLKVHREVVRDAAVRIGKRIGHQAATAADKGAKVFWTWVEDELVADNSAAMASAFGAALDCARALRSNQSEELVRSMVAVCSKSIESRMLAACDCKEDELRASVTAACNDLTTTIPAALAATVRIYHAK